MDETFLGWDEPLKIAAPKVTGNETYPKLRESRRECDTKFDRKFLFG
jgi:hypothetical protein